jgi:DNA-binding transcriptional ArsR family regulator
MDSFGDHWRGAVLPSLRGTGWGRGGRSVMVVSIESLPPAPTCLFKTLEHEGPLSGRQLIERSYLPERTVEDAISRLRESGLVAVEQRPGDAREREYRLAESAR